MKNLTLIIILTLIIACHSVKKEPSEFTITMVRQEKDGQTLFLKDSEDNIYTTVVGITNENYNKMKEGDKVSIKIESVLETNPPIIISKHIKKIN